MRNFAYKKFANSIIRLAIMVSSITCVVIAFTYAKYFDSLTNDYANNEGLPGDIGLRSYFHTGTGTKQDPYVITRPIHYYNLTRLQNLGIFDLNTSHAGDSTNSSDHRYYFQVGYDLDNADKDSNVTTGLDVYASDASDAAVATYLDMSGTTYASNVLSVGNEGMPFYGVYNGSNILIKGLTIHSTPEDVGVFGYVASSGKVENALFSDLTIYDDGYDTANLGFLYTDAAATASTLTYKVATSDATVYNLSKEISDVSCADQIASCNTFTEEQIQYTSSGTTTNGLFTATFPTLSSTYVPVVRSSSSTILPVTNMVSNGTYTNTVSINYDALKDTSSTFYTTNNSELDFRISLVASKTVDPLTYSKVLSTYLVKFKNTISGDTHTLSMNVYRDYVDSTNPDVYTQYAHGSNVGYLVGHTDGTVLNSYVYNEIGTTANPYGIHLNDALNVSGSDTLTHLKTESEIGLIGEIGVNINNAYSPSDMYEKSADTGVVNFTEIYKAIRGSNTDTVLYNGAAQSGGDGNTYKVYSYDIVTGNLFTNYLRIDTRTTGTTYYICPTTNTVDFKNQQIISDTTDENRGLGIFTLTSSANDNEQTDAKYLHSFGSYDIKKDSSNTFTDFYYTTAEYTPSNTTTNLPQATSQWGYNTSGTTYNVSIENQVDMPSYADEGTWNDKYEQKSNYFIRCPFMSSSDLTSNYFYNTDSELLQEYFTYKLKNKTGNPINPGDSNFGVKISDVSSAGVESNITSLDSYLSIAKSSGSFSTLTSAAGTTFASSAISFTVSNKNGANITVLASNFNNCGNYLSIYSKEQSIGTTPLDSAVTKPLYSTYIPGFSSDTDSFKYFNYDPTTGYTDTKASFTTRSSQKLFAHTFYVPEGDYFISSPSNAIHIFYVAAQGQKKGNTGSNELVYTDKDTISNVDFLLYDPQQNKSTMYTDGIVTDSYRAGIYTEFYFSADAGVTEVYADSTYKLHIKYDTTLTNAIIYNRKFTATNNDTYYFGDTAVTKVYYFYN